MLVDPSDTSSRPTLVDRVSYDSSRSHVVRVVVATDAYLVATTGALQSSNITEVAFQLTIDDCRAGSLVEPPT